MKVLLLYITTSEKDSAEMMNMKANIHPMFINWNSWNIEICQKKIFQNSEFSVAGIEQVQRTLVNRSVLENLFEFTKTGTPFKLLQVETDG